MSSSSKFTRKLQKILRKKGKAPGQTGPSLENLLAAAKRQASSGKAKRGRPQAPPRLIIKGNAIKIKYSGQRIETTQVILCAGMDPIEAELVAESALEDFIEKQDAIDRQEVSPEDVELKTILKTWIDLKSSSVSAELTEQRKRFAASLDRDFPVKRLGDIVHGTGEKYIKIVIEGVTDEDKRQTLHNTAINRLNMQLAAINYFYDNLTQPPDHRKTYFIPRKFDRHSEIYLAWDLLMRLLKAAEGWRYDPDTGEWSADPDPDLLVVRRYILIYFYSGTRDATILPLRWGSGFDGGFIDAKNGIIYRKPLRGGRTHKQAKAALLLGTLRDEVKRWEAEDKEKGWLNVIHDTAGAEIRDMSPRFDKVALKAGLPWVTAHDLKHTGVTLLTHAGLHIDVLASAMSTTSETLKETYEHLEFIWLQPRAMTASVDLDLSLEALEKTSPMSGEHWLLNAGPAIKLRLERAEASKQRAKQARCDRRKRAMDNCPGVEVKVAPALPQADSPNAES